MSKKILVTGATGFIGRHVPQLLLERGYEVYGLSTKKEPKGSINWIQADLFDHQNSAALLKQLSPSHLLHFAWSTEPGKCWNTADNLLWVQASLNLAHHFVLNGGKRLVVAGTCAEYDWNNTLCIENHTPCNPSTLYGTCKRALHLILEKYVEQMGISFAWGRIFYVFGPDEHPKRFLPTIIQALLENRPAHLSHGNQWRDFLYVKDIANAFVKLLDSDLQGPINIASGQRVQIKEIAQTVAGLLGGKEFLKLGELPVPANDPIELVADTTRLSSELRWKPQYLLNEAIEETIQWWKQKL